MKTASHLEKITRMCQLRERFDPTADFELWYWTTLTASTNALNASYHLCGLTRADPVFSTIPGVHLVQQADGSYGRELRGPGDVSHLHWPPIGGSKPDGLVEMEHAIEVIESHRDPCLRGEKRPTPNMVEEIDVSFSAVLAVLHSLVKEVQDDT